MQQSVGLEDLRTRIAQIGTATPSRNPAHLARPLRARVEFGLAIEAMTLVVSLTEGMAAAAVA